MIVEKKIKATLVSDKHGYADYDIRGAGTLHRVKIPNGIKAGEGFNAYCGGGCKVGGTWKGTLDATLVDLVKELPRLLKGFPAAEG